MKKYKRLHQVRIRQVQNGVKTKNQNKAIMPPVNGQQAKW